MTRDELISELKRYPEGMDVWIGMPNNSMPVGFVGTSNLSNLPVTVIVLTENKDKYMDITYNISR
ncbi:MAG: hypothetical protein PHN75_07005 [Syntrophales bacterium]|nr:hypothetical protein [Syntrophales bacterium]